jgi:GGDEF domain-containing protein
MLRFCFVVLAFACSIFGSASASDGAANVSVVQAVPHTVTVEQIAGKPESAFSPFSADAIYPIDSTTALWLRIKAVSQSTDVQRGMTFQFPKPFVDKVEFDYRTPQGKWLVESAGDQVTQQRWSIRGIYPQFALPAVAPGTNEFYVKINNLAPMRIDVILKPTWQAVFDHQNSALANGIILGFLLFAVLLGAVLALVYRRSVYVWYAVYLLPAFGSVAAYVGVAHYAFWPFSTRWSDQAGVACLMFATTAQLQFCRAIFGSTSLGLWGNRVVVSGIAVSVASVALYLWWPLGEINARMALMWVCLCITTTLCLWSAGAAALRSSVVAWLWGVAYVPTIAVLLLTLIEEFGIAPMAWLPHGAILYVLGFEAVVLLIALHLHVKEGHAKTVRRSTLADVDPLTGFVAPRRFPKALAEAWADARQRRRDLSVVYVQANFKAGPLRKNDSTDVETAALRCVRIIRTVTREADTVARVHANLFAVLMPGVSPGENLTGKLSRLIALGVMTDRDDPLSEPVNLRIAASSRSRFSGTAQQLDVLLRQKLPVEGDLDARFIMYVSG